MFEAPELEVAPDADRKVPTYKDLTQLDLGQHCFEGLSADNIRLIRHGHVGIANTASVLA